MTDEEKEYYDSVLGGDPEPDEINNIRWVGVDKAVVEHHRDYSSMARDFDFFRNDDIDYLPSIDNIDEDNNNEEEL